MNSSEFRQSLINAATPAETKLLQLFDSDPRFKGRVEFQRQIGKYFVDFFIKSKMLAIELDGSSHISKKKYDDSRTRELKSQGVTVIRFWNATVFKDPESVLRKIFNYTQSGKRRRSSFIIDHINHDCFKNSKKIKKLKIKTKSMRSVSRKRNPVATEHAQRCSNSAVTASVRGI